jgi:small subunit ribosomal protein S1
VSDIEIKSKMKITGKVIKLGLAGAVVDIGTTQPAVLHISQLPPDETESSLRRVEDVLQLGQDIDVWIRRVREDHIELTMNKPLDLEWREIKVGMAVKGQVVRLEKFGAFVDIGAERPGLVHISEMAHGYVRSPEDVVKEGDEVEAEVLDVQRKKKQIKLSMKALLPEPVVEKPTPQQFAQPEREKKDRPPRKQKERKSRERTGDHAEFLLTFSDSDNPEAEAEPTAMEIALREAMDKAKKRKEDQDSRGKKSKSKEQQEELLARTLEHKVKTT